MKTAILVIYGNILVLLNNQTGIIERFKSEEKGFLNLVNHLNSNELQLTNKDILTQELQDKLTY